MSAVEPNVIKFSAGTLKWGEIVPGDLLICKSENFENCVMLISCTQCENESYVEIQYTNPFFRSPRTSYGGQFTMLARFRRSELVLCEVVRFEDHETTSEATSG